MWLVPEEFYMSGLDKGAVRYATIIIIIIIRDIKGDSPFTQPYFRYDSK